MTRAVPTADPFVDLVIADKELLDAEFAAIIAASWPKLQLTVGRGGFVSSGRSVHGQPRHRPVLELRWFQIGSWLGATCGVADVRGGGRAPPSARWPATGVVSWASVTNGSVVGGPR